ncbi:MAG TPA: hypothetical protein VMP01_25975 [Pirellulaceae bacterium]|nr:hypothetical protein [Pirellulaceae bacterium]
MSEAPPLPISPPLSLTHRLTTYLMWWLVLAAIVTGLSVQTSPNWSSFTLHRLGLSVWSAHVLILTAVLTLSVPSLVVAFQLALLAAIVQGYLYMLSAALWSGEAAGHGWDDQVQFVLILGLTAALSAVGCLLVRMVWKMALSPEAAEGTGRSGQLGLRELLYIMASLSAFLAVVSLFSLPGVIPVEQVLSATVRSAGQIGPVTLGPFFLAACGRSQSRHWLWLVPLTLLYVAVYVWAEYASMTWRASGVFIGLVGGTAAAVAANAVALHMLGLTWRRGGAATSSASSPAL